VGGDRSTRLEALLLVAAKLARAESRDDAVRIALVGGIAAIGGADGALVKTAQAPGACAGGLRRANVPVRTRDETVGILTAALPNEEGAVALLEALADLLGAALERHARVEALVRELGHAGEVQQFLAQASESLALSLDDKTTLAVLSGLAVPRIADWCVIDAATREGVVKRVVVKHGEAGGGGATAALAATLMGAAPPLGAVSVESREVLASDLALEGSLPSDLVPVASAIAALSAVVVYALSASDGAVRIALFTAGSGRRLGFDDFALAEELARRTSHALERASLYGEARRANEAKDVFLATVSHELRGPLAAVSMWTHVLGLKKCDDTTRARALQAIDESVRALGRLIEDMIDLSRLVSGNFHLSSAPLSVCEAAKAAVELAGPPASSKGVAVVFRAEADATISGDARRLAQAFCNVVTNAIEFTPPRGRVEVSLSRLPEGIRFDVRDDGEGISPEFLPHVFKPFHQEDASITRARGGLGLGLAVARQIVELHGGTIRASSAGRGTGSTFTVELPLAPRPLGTER
jgi:signal transduction histidine kinase